MKFKYKERLFHVFSLQIFLDLHKKISTFLETSFEYQWVNLDLFFHFISISTRIIVAKNSSIPRETFISWNWLLALFDSRNYSFTNQWVERGSECHAKIIKKTQCSSETHKAFWTARRISGFDWLRKNLAKCWNTSRETNALNRDVLWCDVCLLNSDILHSAFNPFLFKICTVQNSIL